MTDNIKEKIKKGGYWRVVIQPDKSSYKKDRFEISDIGKKLDESQVQLRGWNYPHVELNNVSITAQDKISGNVDFEGHVEFWEFTTSGHFGHIFSMNEDYRIDPVQAEKIKSNFHFNKERAAKAKSFLEVVSTVYRFTEIYLFASNLAQLKEFEDIKQFKITIELYGVKDRLLFIWDMMRSLWSPYICGIEEDKLSFSKEYKKDELIGECEQIALFQAIETFKRFNWDDPNEQAMRKDQSRLLERRL